MFLNKNTKGNVFYSLGFPKGIGGTIRRAASTSDLPTGEVEPGSSTSGSNTEDKLIYQGTGIILALAIDASDNLVFSMGDSLADNGAVCALRMAPGGVPEPQTRPGVYSDSATGGGLTGDNSASSLEEGGGCGVAVTLATSLGPFLPGVAVCPVTGDVYVARGHSGLTRVLKETDGAFNTKV